MTIDLLHVGAEGWLSWPGGRVRAALGRSGITTDKREGDGATPAGTFLLRAVWYRPDRVPVPAGEFAAIAITPQSGWSDDPADPAYNRPVVLPHLWRHERLWREDGLYDVIVPIGYNDDPPVAGLGSAIFLHVAHPAFRPTEGCVAIARDDLVGLLRLLGPQTRIAIG